MCVRESGPYGGAEVLTRLGTHNAKRSVSHGGALRLRPSLRG
jgi:hypothetical protein